MKDARSEALKNHRYTIYCVRASASKYLPNVYLRDRSYTAERTVYAHVPACVCLLAKHILRPYVSACQQQKLCQCLSCRSAKVAAAARVWVIRVAQKYT